MGLDFLTNLLILGFVAMCIHNLIRSKEKEGLGYFFVNILTLVLLISITIRNIELAVPMLAMIVVWEIKSLREDSE